MVVPKRQTRLQTILVDTEQNVWNGCNIRPVLFTCFYQYLRFQEKNHPIRIGFLVMSQSLTRIVLKSFIPKNKTGKLKGNLGTVPLDRALLQLNENLQNLNSSIKEIMSQKREI
ncbi:hypothetical protein BpHYR1_034229 [Brachionus plicatilis]|uniref:Uncharacterized protein n=1 Tax=Brachionus plicatilis TaxID=10195 RepID=A0A3M7R4I3_BRAPC|nr:hypothetical protein BpHYR1_034229 [Brachionus plicatilis]